MSRMTWKRFLALGLTLATLGTGAARAQYIEGRQNIEAQTGSGGAGTFATPDTAASGQTPEEAPLGPTPLLKVNILQSLIYGDGADKAPLKFAGWMDFDYT